MTEQTSDEMVPDESEQLDQIQSGDSLIDRGVDDVLDEGYIAPDHWSPAQGFGNTASEQAQGETLDQRLKQEVPDETVDPEAPLPEVWETETLGADGEVGDERAGRLSDVGTVDGEDVTDEMLAEDEGLSGGAASAEEAAVHIVED